MTTTFAPETNLRDLSYGALWEEWFWLDEQPRTKEIIAAIDNKVKELLQEDQDKNDGKWSPKGEALQNAFLFFMTQISRRRKVQLSEELCIRLVH